MDNTMDNTMDKHAQRRLESLKCLKDTIRDNIYDDIKRIVERNGSAMGMEFPGDALNYTRDALNYTRDQIYIDTDGDVLLHTKGLGDQCDEFLSEFSSVEEMLELYEYLIGLDGKGPSLFDILTSVYLTKSEMADSAKAAIDASMYDLKALRQLKEMARDAKSKCSYMDVCCNVADYIEKAISLCYTREALTSMIGGN